MFKKVKQVFSKGGSRKSQSDSATANKAGKKVKVLVIDGDVAHNWTKLFAETRSDIEVLQAPWRDITVSSYSTCSGRSQAVCTILKQRRMFSPDFVLIREEVRGVGSGMDWRNVLYGLMYACIPSINTLESVVMFCERPIAYAQLLAIRKKYGQEKFPLIEQSYYSDFREMLIGPSFPAVMKVGHGQAGYGKMKLLDHHQFEDFKSVMAMSENYCTAEEFLVGKFDIRIQKIGKHYRAFSRTAMAGQWKTNTGTSVGEEIPMTEKYKFWADECAKCFGGLDIVTVDALHQESDDAEIILEMNGTSSGLFPDCKKEDMGHIRDLCVQKMRQLNILPSRSSIKK